MCLFVPSSEGLIALSNRAEGNLRAPPHVYKAALRALTHERTTFASGNLK